MIQFANNFSITVENNGYETVYVPRENGETFSTRSGRNASMKSFKTEAGAVKFLVKQGAIICEENEETNTTKTATFVMPTRGIKHGEYGGAYGALTRHQDIFFQYFRLRPATMHADVSLDESTGLTTIVVKYTGKLGKRNLEEIECFWKCGFLVDLVY